MKYVKAGVQFKLNIILIKTYMPCLPVTILIFRKFNLVFDATFRVIYVCVCKLVCAYASALVLNIK